MVQDSAQGVDLVPWSTSRLKTIILPLLQDVQMDFSVGLWNTPSGPPFSQTGEGGPPHLSANPKALSLVSMLCCRGMSLQTVLHHSELEGTQGGSNPPLGLCHITLRSPSLVGQTLFLPPWKWKPWSHLSLSKPRHRKVKRPWLKQRGSWRDAPD